MASYGIGGTMGGSVRGNLMPRRQPPAMGGGDINSALQGLRRAVGYSPPQMGGGRPMGGFLAKPMDTGIDSRGIIGGGGGPQPAPEDPMMADKSGKGDYVDFNKNAVDTQTQMAELPAANMVSSGGPSQDQLVQGALIRAQQPGMVGNAGGFQQFGQGRFGGNPPPNVLARRGGIGGADRGGILNRRMALNNRMRSRIGGIAPPPPMGITTAFG